MKNPPPAVAANGRASVLTAEAPPLAVTDLVFTWPGGRRALDHCSLTLEEPGLWMLVGGNGSGKSTLLRLITGLLQPDAGRIERAGKTALVFQNPDHQLLLPSCGSDVQLGLGDHLSTDQRRRAVAEALAAVGLAGLEERPIHQLSGGQKQRLAIAGALASEAALVLLDEPTALLDPESQVGILELVGQLCHRRERPLTALWITHRLEELDHCRGAALMEAGRVGSWQSGAALRQRLTPLRGSRGEG
jgi:energy-coupling factor transport system ATP-binding protein